MLLPLPSRSRSPFARALAAGSASLLAALPACGGSSGTGASGTTTTTAGHGGTGTGASGATGGSATGGSATGGSATGGSGTGGIAADGGTGGGADGGDAGQPSGPVFYVATTGNDGDAGTITAPWRTISHAMSTVAAGATVRVRGGVYGEQVAVGVSGTAGSPITLETYPGEQAIIDGTSVPVVDGAGLLDINGKSHLVVRGLEIRGWKTTTSAVPAGVFIRGAVTDVQLLGNHVHDIVTTVESCNGAGGNAFGVAVYGNATTPISALVIHGNEIDHLRTGCSESLAVNGNVDGFEVSGNLVHDNDNIGIVAIGYEGTAPAAALDMARNGAIRQNTVYNITSQNNGAYAGSLGADGIYVDGGQSIVIEENIVHNTDLGIETASEHAGHTASYCLVRNNVVYYSNVAAVSFGGYDATVGGTDHTAYVNNTFYDDAVELSMNFHVSSVLYQNNLVYSSAGAFQEGATTGVTIDHDLTLQSGAATVFVAPGAPTNGAVAVDLRVAAGTLSQVKGKGIAAGCPAGWTCPAVWGASLNGTADAAGKPRTGAAGVDIGAYQSP